MADGLRESGVTHVAMESTGVDWKPVWNILEGQLEILRVNAQHIQAVPGRKTDQKDSEWIADWLQHGLRKGSFVPPTPVRELRDLTRYRVRLAQECNRIANRVQKVLEDANLKLASVATDALGASGRAMLDAMIEGQSDSGELAEMSRGLLRNKRAELRWAWQGRVTEHHRFRLKQLMKHWRFTEDRMDDVEKEIARRLAPHQEDVDRLCSIPGVDRVTAWGLLAEIGFNMDPFPSAAHLASWAGLCPGNFESAGKRLSGKTRKGSAALRRCLSPAGWAVSTKKDNYLAAFYRRVAARRGAKRAIIAVAHQLLVIAYHLLKRKEGYRELGPNHFDNINADRVRRSLVKRLERLGHVVTLQPVTPSA